MYTSRSEAFGKEFKDMAIGAISLAIRQLQAGGQPAFEQVAKLGYGSEEIFEWGHRWKDAEQCYQAMVMRFERRMFEERGPGFLTDVEAKSIEKMHLNNPYLFDISACEAIAGAANCDHWYRFEKDWG